MPASRRPCRSWGRYVRHVGIKDFLSNLSFYLEASRPNSKHPSVTRCTWQGTYEIIVENTNGTLTSQGAFNMLLICTPPDQAERLLADCQPSLMSIPQSMEIDPVWTVLVAFDHPIFTPFDVLFVEEDACEPIRSAFRESSRYASYDPMKGEDCDPTYRSNMHKTLPQS
jgi:hypothetical protein